MLLRRTPTFNADIAVRQQRERLFQLALFVCLMMVMLDARTSRSVQVSKIGPEQNRPLQDLKDALRTQLGDGKIYATNITGRYSGNWSKQAYTGKASENQPTFKFVKSLISLSSTCFAKIRSSATLSSEPPPKFKITAGIGKFAMQVFMEPLQGLDDLSLVKGYFQITGETEPLHHQLTSSVQGRNTQDGRGCDFCDVCLVMALKSQNVISVLYIEQGSDGSATVHAHVLQDIGSSNLNITEEHQRSFMDAPKHGRRLAASVISSFRNRNVTQEESRMLQTLKDSMAQRSADTYKKAADDKGTNVENKNSEKAVEVLGAVVDPGSFGDAPGSNKTAKIGLTLHPSTSADSNSFVFPFPGTLATPSSTATTQRCLFLFNLKVGPSCDPEKCRKKKDQPHWVMDLNGRMFSENCEVDLNISSHAFRIDWERAYPKAAKYSLLATVVCLVQIVCLFRQLHYTETPASAARVSVLCIGWQAVLDAIVCVVHLLLCAFLPQLFTAFASVAFFKLIIFIVIEMRYIVVISHSRDPQRFFQGGINQLRQEWALIHLRFYGVLFFSLIVLFFFQAYLDLLVLVAYSYWVPQIVTNCIREVRAPFHRDYLNGVSFTRLIIPVYLYGCPANLATFITGEGTRQPNFAMCFALVAWTGVQVGVLVLQEKLGPHFMIPARFLPEKYQYSRPLPRSVLEQAEPESGSQVECVICYMGIEVRGPRKSYMLTPCDHVFHPACLERWMEQKLECPVCRAVLPPPPP